MKWLTSTIAMSLCLLANPTQGLRAQETVDDEGGTGYPALMQAVAAGDVAAVSAIAGPDNVNTSEYGRTPLAFAAELGELEIVKVLVEQGASLDDPATYNPASDGEWHATALEVAAIWGYADIVSYLMDKGAQAPDDLLITVARSGRLDVVKALVEGGASLWGAMPEAPWRGPSGYEDEGAPWSGDALSAAIESGNTEMADYLLRAGAQPSEYAVTAAINRGDLELAKTLLVAGAAVSVGALVAAVQSRDFDLISSIVGAGANVNGMNAWGNTPLAVAAEAGDLAAVRLLISRGALIHKEDGFGMTPLEHIDGESGGDWDRIRRLLDR